MVNTRYAHIPLRLNSHVVSFCELYNSCRNPAFQTRPDPIQAGSSRSESNREVGTDGIDIGISPPPDPSVLAFSYLCSFPSVVSFDRQNVCCFSCVILIQQVGFAPMGAHRQIAWHMAAPFHPQGTGDEQSYRGGWIWIDSALRRQN
jgi:hypothetical protein